MPAETGPLDKPSPPTDTSFFGYRCPECEFYFPAIEGKVSAGGVVLVCPVCDNAEEFT